MAYIVANQNKKSHRIRKSEGAHEVWKKQKKARNAARPKQIWIESQLFIPETREFIRDSHWTREEA